MNILYIWRFQVYNQQLHKSFVFKLALWLWALSKSTNGSHLMQFYKSVQVRIQSQCNMTKTYARRTWKNVCAVSVRTPDWRYSCQAPPLLYLARWRLSGQLLAWQTGTCCWLLKHKYLHEMSLSNTSYQLPVRTVNCLITDGRFNVQDNHTRKQ